MGGFGPLAGAHFYRRLIELTEADGDDRHLPVQLISDPDVPSRILHLRGEGPSPVAKLTDMARRLQDAGVDLIVIPSATVHAYHAEIAASVEVPVLHLPQVAIRAVRDRGAESVALLATTPTVRLGLYRTPARVAGVELLIPDARSQNALMDVITDIKGGLEPEATARRLTEIATGPWAEGAQSLLLGCTDLPAVFPHTLRPQGTADATDELAIAAILAAGGTPRAT